MKKKHSVAAEGAVIKRLETLSRKHLELYFSAYGIASGMRRASKSYGIVGVGEVEGLLESSVLEGVVSEVRILNADGKKTRSVYRHNLENGRRS